VDHRFKIAISFAHADVHTGRSRVMNKGQVASVAGTAWVATPDGDADRQNGWAARQDVKRRFPVGICRILAPPKRKP
jgi:hypothetical protein